jgi:hypothetical protein
VIKTAVKLAFVALLANATWHLFVVYAAHYKFKDAALQIAQYRGDQSDAQVRERILEQAGQYDVPVTSENLSVRTEETHTIVDVSYMRPVDLAPGFTYPWPFTLHIDAFTIKPARFDGLAPK